MNTTMQVAAQAHVAADIFPPAHKDMLTPRQQWHRGYMAFCNLEDIDLLTTEQERAGYMAAMRDCADIETEIYIARQRVRQ